MRTPISEVPVEARRRAAQLLEDIRGTAMAPGADRAGLADEACAVHRPDVDGVAYWEFEVDLRGVSRPVVTPSITRRGGRIPMGTTDLFERLRTRPLDLRLAIGPESGFILVSTGKHDFPVPHWSLDRPPVSRRLEQAADGRKIARVVKVDALGYGGEDADGRFVAQVGQLPIPVDGLPDDPAHGRGRIEGVLSRPSTESKDDEQVEGERSRKQRGDEAARVTFKRAAEKPDVLWSTLTESYESLYGPLLRDLQERAAEAWEVDELAREFGEGIRAGTPHRVALLEDDVRANVTGEGAGVVRMRMLDRGEGPPALELLVDRMPVKREIGFELHLEGSSGLQEELRFFVVDDDTPSNVREGSGRAAFEEDDR